MPLAAIVGVGNMGGAMAHRLLSLGWQVRVHDIDRGKVAALGGEGAIACANARDASRGVPALVIAVVDAAQCDEVLFGAGGACESLERGSTVVLCPTIAPGDVERIAGRLAAVGIDCIEAPMSGGPARARAGEMSLMVGCSDGVFEGQRALLEALSAHVFRIGPRAGDGARMKLVNNLLAGINLVGAAECMALAQRLGLDLETALGVIEASSGQSWIGSDRMRRAVAGDYEPRAHMALLRKDTRLAIEAARAAGFEGPLGAAARDTFERAAQAGLAHLDDAALFKLLSQP